MYWINIKQLWMSHHVVDVKRQNRLKVGTDKSEIKVNMQSVSDDDVRKTRWMHHELADVKCIHTGKMLCVSKFTRWQHISVWNDITAAILKCQKCNSVNRRVFTWATEQLWLIWSRSDWNDRTLGFYEQVSPTTTTTTTTTTAGTLLPAVL